MNTFGFVVVLALACTALAFDRVELKKRQVEEDAEFVGQRGGPVVVVDTPYRGGDDGDEGDVFGAGDDDGFYNVFRRPTFNRPTFFRPSGIDLSYLERRMEFMNRLFNRLFGNGGPYDSPFGGPFDVDDFDIYPPSYDNTTVTTQTVNGSVITVNDTIKKFQTNHSTFFFHVKTIRVRPENETDVVDESSVSPVVPEELVPTTPVSTDTSSQIPNDEDNDVNNARRFRRLASQMDELEYKLKRLARSV